MTDQPSFVAPQPDAQGNYDSPPLAAVRRCWDALLDGQAQDEDLLQTLQAYSDRVQFELNRLESQVFQGTSDPKDPIFAAVVDGFERQLAAVERMAQELEDPEQGHMEVGMELAQRANNALMAAHLRMMARVEQLAQVNCPFCGTSQQRGGERCVQCGRALPGVLDSQSSFSVVQSEGLQASGLSGRAMTENALHLTQSVQAWRGGKLPWEQLYTVLDELEEKLMRHQDSNAQAVVEEGDPRGLLGRTHEALEDSLEALDHMRMAWDKDDDSYLEVGLSKFHEASDEMLKLLELLKA